MEKPDLCDPESLSMRSTAAIRLALTILRSWLKKAKNHTATVNRGLVIHVIEHFKILFSYPKTCRLIFKGF